jgi:hypothetical protein
VNAEKETVKINGTPGPITIRRTNMHVMGSGYSTNLLSKKSK